MSGDKDAAGEGARAESLRQHPPTRELIAANWRLSLGDYLRELRVTADLTQDELSRAVGWDHAQMLSAIEHGRSGLPSDKLAPLAVALGVPLAELARVVLRYQDPWIYAALFGANADLRRELSALPAGKAERRGPRRGR